MGARNGEQLSESLTVRVTPETRKRVERLHAQVRGLRTGALVREAFLAGLELLEAQGPSALLRAPVGGQA